MNSTRFCLAGLNKTLCISSLRRDDITAGEEEKGRSKSKSSRSRKVGDRVMENEFEGLRVRAEESRGLRRVTGGTQAGAEGV